MNYARFAIEHPDIFREAYGDIESFRIGSLLDAGNFEAIGKLIWDNIEAAREGVEDNTVPGGEYGEESRLDERDRARDMNKELT